MGDFVGYQCSPCGQGRGPDAVTYTFPAGGRHLDVVLEIALCQRSTSPADIPASPEASIWRSLPLLPVCDPERFGIPHRAVGWTPSFRRGRLARQLGLRPPWFGAHRRNPTASAKDRASAVTVPRAREVGPETVVTASTGNARAGLMGMAAEWGAGPDPWALETAPERSGQETSA